MFVNSFKKIASLTLLASVFAVAACNDKTPEAQQQSAAVTEKTKVEQVRLAWAGGPRVWVLGKIDKSFEQAVGAPIKWVEFSSGAEVLSLFAANEIDIARFGNNPAIAGISNGLPIEIIGLEGLVATSERLIAKNEVGELKALEGKTVAYPPNSTAQYALEAAIKLNQLDKQKIKLVALKPAEMVSAWSRGDIDAAYVWGPFSQQLEAQGGKQIFATEELNKQGILVYNNFAVRKEFAQQHPELIAAFLANYQRKVDEYQQDPAAASQKIADYLNLPFDQVSTTLAGIEYIPLNVQASSAYLGDQSNDTQSGIAQTAKAIADFLVQTGELAASKKLDNYAPYINSSYLKQAVTDSK